MPLTDNHYTNIRYHIYRELAKYAEKQEQRRSSIITDFTVPIFSGVVVALIVPVISKIEFGCLIEEIFFKVLIPIVVYIFIVIVAGKIVLYVETHIIPNLCPLKNSSTEEIDRHLDDYVAKFNYEVTYLVKTAYILSKDTENGDEWLLRMNTVETCFYISNALRKISESVIAIDCKPSSAVTSNRVYVIMSMIFETLSNLENRKTFLDDVEPLKKRYNDFTETLEANYQIVLRKF